MNVGIDVDSCAGVRSHMQSAAAYYVLGMWIDGRTVSTASGALVFEVH